MATVDPGGPMMRRLRTALLAVLFLVPALPAVAVTRPSPPRLPPNAVSPLPSYVRRVEPAVVGLRVKARADAPSSQRLGAPRAGRGDGGGLPLLGLGGVQAGRRFHRAARRLVVGRQRAGGRPRAPGRRHLAAAG